VTYTFRVLIFVLPVLAALFAWRLCHDLAASERHAREEPPPPPSPASLLVSAADSASGAVGQSVVGAHRRSRLRRASTALAVALATLFGFVAGRRKRTETIYIEERHRF
jgi:hypothetical protein